MGAPSFGANIPAFPRLPAPSVASSGKVSPKNTMSPCRLTARASGVVARPTTDAPLAELTLVGCVDGLDAPSAPTFLRAVASSSLVFARPAAARARAGRLVPTLLRARRALAREPERPGRRSRAEVAALWASAPSPGRIAQTRSTPTRPRNHARCDPILAANATSRLFAVFPARPRRCATLFLRPSPQGRPRDAGGTEQSPASGGGGSPESPYHPPLSRTSRAGPSTSPGTSSRDSAPRGYAPRLSTLRRRASTRRATSPSSPRVWRRSEAHTARSTPTTVCGTARRRRRTASRRVWSSNTACTRRERTRRPPPPCSLISQRRRRRDSADLLEHIIIPKVTHCATVCDGSRTCTNDATPTLGTPSRYSRRGESSAGLLRRFHQTVWRHFRGVLKPPFNDEARARASSGKSGTNRCVVDREKRRRRRRKGTPWRRMSGLRRAKTWSFIIHPSTGNHSPSSQLMNRPLCSGMTDSPREACAWPCGSVDSALHLPDVLRALSMPSCWIRVSICCITPLGLSSCARRTPPMLAADLNIWWP